MSKSSPLARSPRRRARRIPAGATGAEGAPGSPGAVPPAPFAPRGAVAAARDRFIRRVVTTLGIHATCGLAVCRRAAACAGRHLPCHDEHADALRPIFRSIIDHRIMAAVAAGEAEDIAPASIALAERRLAAEYAAAARIAAGGPVDEDSAYELWLRAAIVPRLRPRDGSASHLGDGSGHDPDAKLRE